MKSHQQTRRRRVLTRYSAADRERLIRGHAASGLTRRAFCEKQGINLMTFNGWFKSPRAKAGQPQFAEVAMPPVVHAAAIEIDLCTGTRIRLHDGSQLQPVLIALREVGAC